MTDRLAQFLERSHDVRILVVGDLMLDRYITGEVNRISPEAPIPLLRSTGEVCRLGGAASVAAMLSELGAEVALVGVVGDDADGRQLVQRLKATGIDIHSVLTVASRRTTVKQRLAGHTHHGRPQQLIRIDYEDDAPLDVQWQASLLDVAIEQLTGADLALVSDYDKGVCAGNFLPRFIAAASAQGIRVIVDPACGVDYQRYRGASCLKPNRIEAACATGISIDTPHDGLRAAARLLQLGLDAAVVTLDRDGIACAAASGARDVSPIPARTVVDVTGAGDMVLATLGYALTAGLDYPAAIHLANIAASLEVQRYGAVPISRNEIAAALCPPMPSAPTKQSSADEKRRKQRTCHAKAGKRSP